MMNIAGHHNNNLKTNNVDYTSNTFTGANATTTRAGASSSSSTTSISATARNSLQQQTTRGPMLDHQITTKIATSGISGNGPDFYFVGDPNVERVPDENGQDLEQALNAADKKFPKRKARGTVRGITDQHRDSNHIFGSSGNNTTSGSGTNNYSKDTTTPAAPSSTNNYGSSSTSTTTPPHVPRISTSLSRPQTAASENELPGISTTLYQPSASPPSGGGGPNSARTSSSRPGTANGRGAGGGNENKNENNASANVRNERRASVDYVMKNKGSSSVSRPASSGGNRPPIRAQHGPNDRVMVNNAGYDDD